MARTNPQEFAAKWAARTASATDAYRQGVQRVTQAPGAAAAAKKDTWRQRTMDAGDKWARKVAAVDLGSWQQMAATKGANNISTGVNAAIPKMQAAAQTLLSNVDSAVSAVKGMPNATLDQRIARSAEFQRRMHNAYTGQGR